MDKPRIKYIVNLLIIVSLSLSFTSGITYGQTFSNSNLKVTNYTTTKSAGHVQNFSMIQDERGVMYFSNGMGVLEYSGKNWELIKIQDDIRSRAIAKDDNGTIYVGANNEIGYLESSKNGIVEFKSLINEIDSIHQDFGDVWKVINIGDKMLFLTKKVLFIRGGKEMKYIDALTSTDSTGNEISYEFTSAFFFKDKTYIVVRDIGLHQLNDSGELVLIPGGEIFADTDICDITFFGGKNIIFTSKQGVYEFIIEENEFLKLIIPEIDALPENSLYNGIKINSSLYSIGLFGDGIIILDNTFRVVQQLNMDNGLQDETVNYQFVDHEENLWLGLSNGISKVEISSAINEYGYSSGVKGTIEKVTRQNDKVYATSNSGVFYMELSDNTNKFNRFDDVAEFFGSTSALVNNEEIFLIAGIDGIYQVSGDTLAKIHDNYPWTLSQSKTDPKWILTALDDGFEGIKFQNGNWVSKRINDINDITIFNFKETSTGDIWMGTLKEGIIKCNIAALNGELSTIERYGQNDGLPSGSTFIELIDDIPIVGTDNGLFVFNVKEKVFERSNDYGINFNEGEKGIHRLSVDPQGKIWMSIYDESKIKDKFTIGYSKLVDGKYVWYDTPFLPYADKLVKDIHHDSEGKTWLGTTKGILRFDSKINKTYDQPFPVLIRKVFLNKDSILFGGAFGNSNASFLSTQPEDQYITIDYAYNEVKFTFSATTFHDEGKTKYNYKLLGKKNDDWSGWKDKTDPNYTNLDEGEYTFMVKARNIYNQESEITTYKFTILPPWYRTIWAYLTYFVLFVSFVYGAITISTRSLKKVIRDATAEIVEQKEEIEKQKEIVDEKNKDIMDSIKYAKHIQDAILPVEEFLKETFKDVFVLFRPKDIVSGDFYWATKIGNKILFAAVDCTGHGVPGAFVSIVGNNGLNRAVNEFGLTEPAAILDKLNEFVLETFGQQGATDIKDGMDIALCALDLDTDTLEYAGANNPLYYIRNGEFSEIKANKQPIGSFSDSEPFTNHSLKMEKDDCIYIFSDGYADQFGGERGKKFKYKPFKELLISLNDRPMSTQKDAMNTTFEKWMTGFEQIDDVCIIGVRV